MSTPTLVRTIRSSSAMSRPGAVNRPSVGGNRGLGRFECRFGHGELDAFGGEAAAEFLANEWVFLVVQDRPTALVDAEQVARFDVVAALVVGDAPARVWSAPVVDHPQWILGGAKVLVEPVATAGRGGDQAAWHVLEHAHFVGLAILPRRRPRLDGPVVRIALAAQAHQHRA